MKENQMRLCELTAKDENTVSHPTVYKFDKTRVELDSLYRSFNVVRMPKSRRLNRQRM